MLKGLLGSYTLAARLVAPEGERAPPPHRVMLADAAPKEGRRLGAHSATIMTAYTCYSLLRPCCPLAILTQMTFLTGRLPERLLSGLESAPSRYLGASAFGAVERAFLSL